MERQAGVERERVQNERDRLMSELQAPRTQQRQSAYHAFLDACQTFHQDQSGTPSMTREQVAEWLTEFEHRLNAVSLFGTRAAYEASQRVQRARRSRDGGRTVRGLGREGVSSGVHRRDRGDAKRHRARCRVDTTMSCGVADATRGGSGAGLLHPAIRRRPPRVSSRLWCTSDS